MQSRHVVAMERRVCIAAVAACAEDRGRCYLHQASDKQALDPSSVSCHASPISLHLFAIRLSIMSNGSA